MLGSGRNRRTCNSHKVCTVWCTFSADVYNLVDGFEFCCGSSVKWVKVAMEVD